MVAEEIKPEPGRVDEISDMFRQREVLRRSANLCVCL